MSPEYAMEGKFSEKSDVFSFGVLLLEIVSGRKNSSLLPDDEQSLNLLGHVSTISALYLFFDQVLPCTLQSAVGVITVVNFEYFQAWMMWKENR